MQTDRLLCKYLEKNDFEVSLRFFRVLVFDPTPCPKSRWPDVTVRPSTIAIRADALVVGAEVHRGLSAVG